MSNAVMALNKGATQGELIQLVSFNLGPEQYAVEVLKVREIIRMTSITHIPSSPGVEGIINLRGKVIPIVSLRDRFGMVSAESDHHTRIMVMDIRGKLMGFIVDGVSEVIRIASSEIQPAPDLVSGGADQEVISGVIRHGETLLLMLQLDRIFAGYDDTPLAELEG